MCHVHSVLFFLFVFCFTFVNTETVDYFDMALWSPFLPLFNEKHIRDYTQFWSSPGDRTKDQMVAICCGRTARPCPELESSLLPGSRGKRGSQHLLLVWEGCSEEEDQHMALKLLPRQLPEPKAVFGERWKAGVLGQERHIGASSMQKMISTCTSEAKASTNVNACMHASGYLISRGQMT